MNLCPWYVEVFDLDGTYRYTDLCGESSESGTLSEHVADHGTQRVLETTGQKEGGK